MATGPEDNKGNIPKKRADRAANIKKNKATPAHKYKVSESGKKQASK
jgi:hypothetical protein